MLSTPTLFPSLSLFLFCFLAPSFSPYWVHTIFILQYFNNFFLIQLHISFNFCQFQILYYFGFFSPPPLFFFNIVYNSSRTGLASGGWSKRAFFSSEISLGLVFSRDPGILNLHLRVIFSGFFLVSSGHPFTEACTFLPLLWWCVELVFVR